MAKCICGYEMRLPGEQEMYNQYGCAKTIVQRSGPFASLTVTQCSWRGGEDPEPTPENDGQDYMNAYLQKYKKDVKPKDDGGKK